MKKWIILWSFLVIAQSQAEDFGSLGDMAECFKKLYPESAPTYLNVPVPGKAEAHYVVTPKNILVVQCQSASAPEPKYEVSHSGAGLIGVMTFSSQYSTPPDRTGLDKDLVLGCGWLVNQENKKERNWVLAYEGERIHSPTQGNYGANNTDEVKKLVVERLAEQMKDHLLMSVDQKKLDETEFASCLNVPALQEMIAAYQYKFRTPKTRTTGSTNGTSDRN